MITCIFWSHGCGCLQEKKLVAEIKKTAKTGNEVCFAPAKFVHLVLSQRTTTRSSTDCPHNRMKLILLWSIDVVGYAYEYHYNIFPHLERASWPVIGEDKTIFFAYNKSNLWSTPSSNQLNTFSERDVCQPGCNKDTGSAVDKITPADCKASGQPCTDAGCGYSHTGEKDHWLK